jgi:hypothetical protein
MVLNRHRRFASVIPVAFVFAIALAVGLYLSFSQSGEAAITPISGDDPTSIQNAAICVGTSDTDPFVEAELVDTATCPDTGENALPYSTKWAELDFSGSRIRSEFAPAAGELDGLRPGARIDLRGTGVNQNEIDLSEAIKSVAGTNRELYCAIAFNVGEVGDSGEDCADTATLNGRSPTFLLDGGDDETGLGNLPTSVDEGAILYIPFHFGDRPRGVNFPVKRGIVCQNSVTSCVQDSNTVQSTDAYNGERGSGDSVERFVAFELTITHKGLDLDRTVYVLTSSRDPDDTLYVVPVLISGDLTIDDDEDAKVEVTGVQVGRYQSGDPETAMVSGSDLFDPTGFDLQFLFDRGAVLDGYDDDFEDNLATAVDTVRVEDVDSPRYPVCERHPQVIEAIESAPTIDEKCQRISLHALSTIESLAVYPRDPSKDDPLEEIYYSDLEGLTGLTSLDLAGNELRNLPSNVFRDVGVGKPNATALIDLRFNPGRRQANDGFLASDVSSSVRSNLQHLQVLRVDSQFRDGKGFDRTAYNVYESDVLVFEVRNDDAAPVVQFLVDTSADPADTAEPRTDDNPDLPQLPAGSGTQLVMPGTGTYIVAVQMPFTGDEDRDNETFTLQLLDTENGSAVSNVDTAKVTIRDVTRARTRTISTSSQVYQPPRRPTSRPAPSGSPSFDYPAFVIGNQYEVAPGNPDLRHNIPDLSVNIGGRTVIAGFLGHYRNTGGRDRWGYPTSEVLVLEDRTLTQFYQRGVVDFHDVGAGWVVERRLAWDYVGGGAGGSFDQGFESGPFNPNPGTLVGPWGNRVSNISIEGTNVGFADYFNRLGGINAFGFPKTEARADIVGAGRLLGPEQTPGFIRQYFQAAIFEYHPNVPSNPVQLALLGDTLRDQLVRDHTRERAFAAAGILFDGARYVPPVID